MWYFMVSLSWYDRKSQKGLHAKKSKSIKLQQFLVYLVKTICRKIKCELFIKEGIFAQFSSDDIPKKLNSNIVTDQGLMNQNTDKKYMNRYQLLDLAGLVQPTWKFRTESTDAVSPPFPLKRPKMAIWGENNHLRKD